MAKSNKSSQGSQKASKSKKEAKPKAAADKAKDANMTGTQKGGIN